LTDNEQKLCKSAFDQLCTVAQQGISSWKCESEIGIISVDWSVRKQTAGRAFLRAALLEFLDGLTENVPVSEVISGTNKVGKIANGDSKATANYDLAIKGRKENATS
jgi:hypothetical protein